MIRIFRKLVDGFLGAVLIFAIIFIFLLFGIRLFSITPYVVTSGSMDPVYPVGSIVYVKQLPPEKLNVGDDISFYFSEDVVATHRIGEIHEEERNVQTYGVNNIDSEGNQINDANPVDFDHIIGKVQFSIPILGFAYMFIQTTQGKIALITVVLALFAISKILQYLEKEKRQ